MHDPPEPDYSERQAMLERLRAMSRFTPQAHALGIEVTRMEHARAWGKAPYKAELVGDPDTGVIAGGVLTTYLDQLCGAAALAAMETPATIATLDLRIDYMRPATPGRDVLAEAHCYKIGKNVAFVRAIAYEETPNDPIAHAVAAFMVRSDASRKAGANLRATPP